MQPFRFGIVGPGFIAGVIADAIESSGSSELTVVSSRTLSNAERFVQTRPETRAVQGIDALLAADDIDAVYVATPTSAKEAIALAAIAAGKHVLVDKPLASLESAERITSAARDAGVLYMDATHFPHHPRTETLRTAIAERLATANSLHTAFYFPFSERNNIRFDTTAEPMGALGDMAWYSMRAVVEYLQPEAELASVAAVAQRDAETNAIVRVGGQVAFADGKASTFDVGYTASTAVMDLSLLGSSGVISMDDFVLDWTNSFAFENPDIPTGFVFRTGLATRAQTEFIATPSSIPQEVLMVEHFAAAAREADPAAREAYAKTSVQTQRYLDAVFAAAR